jgi:ABC-type enterochelin transport system permease subunit
MPSSTSFRDSADQPGTPARLIVLWTGVLIGPLAWLGVLEANYVLSYVACDTQHRWYMHAVVALAVVLVAIAGSAAWRQSRTVESAETTTWLAIAGALMSAFFVIVILATDIPVLAFRPCQ